MLCRKDAVSSVKLYNGCSSLSFFLSKILTLSPVCIYTRRQAQHTATATRRTIGHRGAVTSGYGSSILLRVGGRGAATRTLIPNIIILFNRNRFLHTK